LRSPSTSYSIQIPFRLVLSDPEVREEQEDGKELELEEKEPQENFVFLEFSSLSSETLSQAFFPF